MDRHGRGLWAEVEALVLERGSAQVEVPLSFVQPVMRQERRPRARSVAGAGWLMKTPAGHALRCRNRGCTKYVPRKSEEVTCSLRCAHELREYCETMLDILNGRLSAKDCPAQFLSQAVLQERKKCA